MTIEWNELDYEGSCDNMYRYRVKLSQALIPAIEIFLPLRCCLPVPQQQDGLQVCFVTGGPFKEVQHQLLDSGSLTP